jgi:hypothetical protein
MQFFSAVREMLIRFRYPVSLPEDVAESLGVAIDNTIEFQNFINICHSLRPTRLTKFMPRMEAERAFHSALRKEKFSCSSLYSFYFNEGWLEFELQFDANSLLRRVYLHHKLISGTVELNLAIDESSLPPLQRDTSEGLYIA